MKRTVIFLLTVVLFMANVNDNSNQIHAQVMTRERSLPVPRRTSIVCPYCGEKQPSLAAAQIHQAVCPYRYRIEYTYDAAGNRIRRATVWKVAPKVIERRQELNKIQQEDSIQVEP